MILDILSELLTNRTEAVEDWLSTKAAEKEPAFYSSVDLRHSGHKLAPVDTNLFPAGFNNLPENDRTQAAHQAQATLKRRFPDASSLLIIPENHTRNKNYIHNLQILQTILTRTGMQCRIGRMEAEVNEPVILETPDGTTLTSTPIHRINDRIETIDGWQPDILLVNNDFTSGCPEMLCDIQQPVIPPPGMGWYRRRKSEHFTMYQRLTESFGNHFAIDPWLINTVFHRCGLINFREQSGIECVALNVEKVLHRLRSKYQEYRIRDEPYVYVKADSGTYGMGIMQARSGEDITGMNKKNPSQNECHQRGRTEYRSNHPGRDPDSRPRKWRHR